MFATMCVAEAEATQVSTEGRMDKVQCIPTRECHSAVEGKETLTLAMIWMSLKDNRLSEI